MILPLSFGESCAKNVKRNCYKWLTVVLYVFSFAIWLPLPLRAPTHKAKEKGENTFPKLTKGK